MPGKDTALLAIAAAGLVIRVTYTVAVGQHVPLGISDATFYHFAADRLAAGDGFVDPWRAFETGAVEPTAHHPPGWPALLAMVSLLGGGSQLAHRLTGCAVGAAVVLAVGVLGRRAAGRTAGLVAAGIVAVHPTFVAADGSLMAETLAGLAVLGVLILVHRLRTEPARRWALASGVAVGAAALVRAEALLYLPVLLVPLALLRGGRAGGPRPWRRGLGLAAAVLVGAAAVVGPWTVRNAAQVGGFVPVSTNDATVLAGANCAASYHGPNLGGWSIECVRFGTEGLSEHEAARRWRSRGLTYAGENLGRLPAVAAVRALRTWGIWDPLGTQGAEGRQRGVQRAGNVVWLGGLLPLGIAGAVVLARRDRWADLAILGSPAVVATAVTVAGFGMLRFRHGMELAAAVLAGVAVAAAARSRGNDLHVHAR